MERSIADRPRAQVEILAYAPTEFYHCQHCEVVWDHIGFGRRLHSAERESGLLPDDLKAEYTAISDWTREAFARYGDRLSIKVIDAVSVEGLLKSIRHGTRRFPVFIVNSREAIAGFDRDKIDQALEQRLRAGGDPLPARERG